MSLFILGLLLIFGGFLIARSVRFSDDDLAHGFSAGLVIAGLLLCAFDLLLQFKGPQP